ncbi:hypothetical protein QBC34DRAFT_440146 [Podospora aff. communis PSN243]|uniref:Uncharacterized protein n=1 Tax=Podospora aff. communis PSN243 TaxID=3040156 RepID=A0AAV9GHJ7_9PEZI|nr:hypothetical protein QBC34DRAFT_440146 [Podospora aff. communis PSN243]
MPFRSASRSFSAKVAPRPLHQKLKSNRSLDDLIFWAIQANETNLGSQAQFRSVQKDLSAAQTRIKTLESKIVTAEAHLRDEHARYRTLFQGAEAAKQRHQGELVSRDSQHASRIASLEHHHAQTIAAMDFQHARRIASMESQHASNISDMVASHSMELATTIEQHAAEAEGLNRRITQLTSEIMADQKDSRAWNDEKLKQKFAALQQSVDKITSPWSLSFRPDWKPSSTLAPFGAGDDEHRCYLIRHEVWSVLIARFLSVPLGFGALGPQGEPALLGIFSAWRELFIGTSKTGESRNPLCCSWLTGWADFLSADTELCVKLFSNGREANKWRASTFESIAGAIAAESGEVAASLRQLFNENLQAAIDGIMSILATGISCTVSADAVHEVVRSAAELGLQLGVHPAQLELTRPKRETEVEIGPEFHDYADGANKDKGKKIRVDIAVSPGLNKLGGGAGNTDLKTALAACVIYPLA